MVTAVISPWLAMVSSPPPVLTPVASALAVEVISTAAAPSIATPTLADPLEAVDTAMILPVLVSASSPETSVCVLLKLLAYRIIRKGERKGRALIAGVAIRCNPRGASPWTWPRP